MARPKQTPLPKDPEQKGRNLRHRADQMEQIAAAMSATTRAVLLRKAEALRDAATLADREEGLSPQMG